MQTEPPKRKRRCFHSGLNMPLFRLACCCGRRSIEIAKRQVGNLRSELARLHIRIRNGVLKGGRSRIVPLGETPERSTTYRRGRLIG